MKITLFIYKIGSNMGGIIIPRLLIDFIAKRILRGAKRIFLTSIRFRRITLIAWNVFRRALALRQVKSY